MWEQVLDKGVQSAGVAVIVLGLLALIALVCALVGRGKEEPWRISLEWLRILFRAGDTAQPYTTAPVDSRNHAAVEADSVHEGQDDLPPPPVPMPSTAAALAGTTEAESRQ